MTSPDTDTEDERGRERELHDLVRRSTEHVRAPLPRLFDNALEDGHRLVRRRRIATAMASAAAVAVAALVVPLALGAGRATTPADAGLPAASGPASSDTRAAPGDEARHTTQVPVGAVEVVGGSALLGALRSSGPEGVLLLSPGRVHATTREGTSVERTRILRPGVASGQVRAGSSPITSVPSCPSRLGRAAPCSVLVDSATGRVVGTLSSASFGSVHVNEVAVVVPGEGRQTLGVANTDDDVWGPGSTATGDTAPLSGDELVTLASQVLSTPVRR